MSTLLERTLASLETLALREINSLPATLKEHGQDAINEGRAALESYKDFLASYAEGLVDGTLEPKDFAELKSRRDSTFRKTIKAIGNEAARDTIWSFIDAGVRILGTIAGGFAGGIGLK